MAIKNRYSALIEAIFWQYYKNGDTQVNFQRQDIDLTATKLNIILPKNLGDVIYSFKYRASLPDSIIQTVNEGYSWVIANIGRAHYAFKQIKYARILPDSMLVTIKIPDATPSIVEEFALDDEQALLTKLRYNRLIDIFTGATCYSLQNHLRTTVPDIGQVETDEIYVGIDKSGKQYIFPVQAKGGKDEIGTVQIEQDIKLCEHKYPLLICRAIAAQFMGSNKIAMFEFAIEDNYVRKFSEKHYQLVKERISEEDIKKYNSL